ncbi:hypothetical protein H8S37_04665 [Mediterraneibacter sp. NSJ-55]|uniref:Uncharacterized protein n=1 Tax=Mediterraneibacter hominis TaxID=2763054 RepID=A0A923LHL9_9FIRM|nr:hypothetical protein [Mediterraneibacter hominis]MBC5688221.1 hypothetical protein [Mediterraneibacter hominis]
MTKSNEIAIRELTLIDKINMIDNIVSACFTDGEYTPYYYESSLTIAIALYCINGITFEENESVYDTVMADEQIKVLIDDIKEHNSDICEIEKHAIDIIKFKKQQIIHGSDTLRKLGEFLDVFVDALSGIANLNIQNISNEDMKLAVEFMQNMKDKNITETTIANAMNKVIKNHKVPNTKIYEGQRERIAEQQKQLKEKDAEITALKIWKQEHEK